MKRGNFIILLWSLTNILDFDLFHYLHTLHIKNTTMSVWHHLVTNTCVPLKSFYLNSTGYIIKNALISAHT